MSDLLTVALHTPDLEEFNPEEAINHWYTNRRRLNFQENQQLKKGKGILVAQTAQDETIDGPNEFEAVLEAVGQSGTANDSCSDYESDADSVISLDEAVRDLEL